MPETPSGESRRKESFLLDQFTLHDIRKYVSLRDDILRMHRDFFNHLAFKRSRIMDSLKRALLEATEQDYCFEKYQRVVKYSIAHDPLSVAGSLIDPGGRFNIGDIERSTFPIFPAVYLAEDKETALQEALCVTKDKSNQQSDLDFALTNPASIAVVSVRGKLESVINLNRLELLGTFVSLIKDFDLPAEARRISAKHKIPLDIVRDIDGLGNVLLSKNWRMWPMQFDVPASSQVFGQLVSEAGIEGIIYPSRHNDKICLAIFPQNFRGTSSFIELEEKPLFRVGFPRLDSNTSHVVACAEVPEVDAERLKTLFPKSIINDLISSVRNLRIVRWLFGGRQDN